MPDAHIEDGQVCQAGQRMNQQSKYDLQLPHHPLCVLQAPQEAPFSFATCQACTHLKGGAEKLSELLLTRGSRQLVVGRVRMAVRAMNFLQGGGQMSALSLGGHNNAYHVGHEYLYIAIDTQHAEVASRR
jgi:hypothetical protein